MKNKVPGKDIIKRYFPLEYPIAAKQWEFYRFEESVIPPSPGIKLPNFRVNQLIVKKMYEKKKSPAFFHQFLKAGDLNAIALITDIFRYLLNVYRLQVKPDAFRKLWEYIEKHISESETSQIIKSFSFLFPPRGIPQGDVFITGTTDNLPNMELIAKEKIVLSLANKNPAFSPFLELFSDLDLAKACCYQDAFTLVENYFKTQPGFGPRKKALIDLLWEPILASPYSLLGQLMYIKENWHSFLPDEFLKDILVTIDVIKEELSRGGPGAGPALVLDFKGLEEYQDEYEGFTKDKDWMSKVVIIAKSTYVWLDQLSKKYQREVNRLDQIPDEELDRLAGWGFNAVWLIGLWERSPASRKIKQICGNPEALASAYSIYDYTISNELGGESAFNNLKQRAEKRGMIIAADIVPNHTGIYSKWVIEHPDWFIQLDHSPYPSYGFNGEDLSFDSRVCLQIEDGYWSRRDAAVCFRRLDKWTGETRFIYHGNDGTSMPWNDTAQLNFLRADVREAVIQNILQIARNFPVIRLDAAMTLTKKHYQRLWFPQAGTGGGIPSRAERGLLRAEFDSHMPREFWREVVDRINKEAPNTLLIAEAFWLMEGYFVRTLGMHRVYNSAFMNMLKAEDNAKYRLVMKNVLEFNPEILRRFVNFMNNPDEETAVVQFGKGDKYFGICLLMVTLPGMPMFGHGQIEGFAEKYGMEYRRSYWHEEADWDFIRRHEYDIFPLMKKRHLFSGIDNFVLYDFYTSSGNVDENVFVYSNRCSGERALIIYNNSYSITSGWVRTSAAFSVPAGGSGERKLIQKTLAEGLGLQAAPGYYYIFRDHKANLEYIRPGSQICNDGLYSELRGYQYHIFMSFREVTDSARGYYGRLCDQLQGRGVPDMEKALEEIIFAPVHSQLENLISRENIESLFSRSLDAARENLWKNKISTFVQAVADFVGCGGSEAEISREIAAGLFRAVGFKHSLEVIRQGKVSRESQVYLFSRLSDTVDFWQLPAAWVLLYPLGKISKTEDFSGQNIAWWHELSLFKALTAVVDKNCYPVPRQPLLIKIMVDYADWEKYLTAKNTAGLVHDMFNDRDLQEYLGFNYHNNILWLNKERLEDVCYWLFVAAAIKGFDSRQIKNTIAVMDKIHQPIKEILAKAQQANYQVNTLVSLLSK